MLTYLKDMETEGCFPDMLQTISYSQLNLFYYTFRQTFS